MGNDDILIPGIPVDIEDSKPSSDIPENLYLLIDEALSEIADNGTYAQSKARQNLNVYSTEETDSQIIDQVNTLHGHLKIKIQEVKAKVSELLSDNEEIHEQLNLQSEIFPTKDENNTFKDELKQDICKKFRSYPKRTDVNDMITNSLINYVTNSYLEKYVKDKLYTKREIDDYKTGYIKKDGSTPFLAPQKGVYPKFRKELATAGYVLDRIQDHKDEEDPHGFTKKLNTKLGNYYTKSEVYKRAETYSREMIDSMIDKLVKEACDSLIEEHINVTSHLTSQDVLRIIKIYALDNLVNKSEQSDFSEKINDQINSGLVWKTSGAIESTVGFMEDNSEVPDEMTLQEIMDAIFYGKGISLDIADDVNIGDSVEITICIHGSTVLVRQAELYQDGKLIKTFDPKEFEEGCVTITTEEAITEDTEFTFKVIYNDESELEQSKTVKCNMPIFIGSKPKMNQANTLSWQYLEDLEKNGYGIFTNMSNTSYEFNFIDLNLRELFIAVPLGVSELKSMDTENGQNFGINAFNTVDVIPFRLTKIEKDVLYKIYVYKQALSNIHQLVTFNFKEE